MRCRHVQERLLELYLSGQFQVPDGLRPHLERCSHCRAEAHQLALGAQALAHIPTAEPPAGLRARVFERIAQDRTREPLPVRLALLLRQPAVEWSIVGALILVVALTAGVVMSRPPHDARTYVDAAGALQTQLQSQELLTRSYVLESTIHLTTLREAQLALEEIANAGNDFDRVARIGAQVQASGLPDRLSRLAEVAEGPDKQLIKRIAHVLEEIANL